jgi:hypothetical protein
MSLSPAYLPLLVQAVKLFEWYPQASLVYILMHAYYQNTKGFFSVQNRNTEQGA